MLFAIVAACLVASAVAHEGHDHTTHQQQFQDSTKIMLTIYYESLCPDSIKFFKDQLSPTYNILKNYISLDFVPFGKSSQTYRDGTYYFTCNHGETECYGNIVQACAVNTFHDEDIYKFVSCVMTDVNKDTVTNTTYPTAQCLNKLSLQQTKINECINGPKGLEELSDMGNRTAKLDPKLKNVPSVAVNKKFDYTESKDAVTDLKSFVCKKLKVSNKNVKECNGTGILASSMLLLTMSSILRAFFS